MSIEEWGTPISKDKIIYRRNKLIELAKVEATPYTIWYETVNENILDINYMIYEIDRLNNIIEELEEDLDYEINDYKGNIDMEEETLSGEFCRGIAFEADYLKNRIKYLKEGK